MNLAFGFCAARAGDGAASLDLAQVSDVELLQRYPALALGGAALFVVGLVCDGYLLHRWWRGRSHPVFRVNPAPWGLYELGLVAAAFVGLNLLMLIGAQRFADHEDLLWRFSLWATLGINLVLLAGMGFIFRQHGRQGGDLLGLDARARGRGAVYGVVGYFAMLPPLAVVGGLYAVLCRALDIAPVPQPVVQLLVLTDSHWVLALVVALAVAVAPVFEEVLFRGFAYPAIKRRLGMWNAMIVVSVAFALVHFHLPSAGPLFALGMTLCLAYEFTGSILAPILMHSLFNTANVLMLLYVRAQS